MSRPSTVRRTLFSRQGEPPRGVLSRLILFFTFRRNLLEIIPRLRVKGGLLHCVRIRRFAGRLHWREPSATVGFRKDFLVSLALHLLEGLVHDFLVIINNKTKKKLFSPSLTYPHAFLPLSLESG